MTSITTAYEPPGQLAASDLCLHLLPDCVLRHDHREVRLRPRVQRLLVLLATARGRRLSRSVVAGTLWPEVTDARAGSSLRSTLRLVPGSPAGLLVVEGATLRLGPAVRVDWAAAEEAAREVLARGGDFPPEVAVPLLRHPLLPHWSDEWLEADQHAFARQRVAALEALTGCLSRDGRHGLAIEAGLLAVACDPLRETAQHALIAAHLAQGNRCVALEQYRRYERLLAAELDVAPGAELQHLVGG